MNNAVACPKAQFTAFNSTKNRFIDVIGIADLR